MGENAPEESRDEPAAPLRSRLPRIALPKVQPKGVARSAAKKVSARWLTILLTGAFLAVTAAFGGLSPAETEAAELTAVDPGEEFAGELLSITVQRVTIEDYDDDALLPEPGKRRLTLFLTVQSHWDSAVGAVETVLSAVTVPSIPGEPEEHESAEEDPAALVEELLGEQDSPAEPTELTSQDELATARSFEVAVSRLDDGTVLPWLQPQIPVDLALEWSVDDQLFTDGDELHVVLHELEVFTYEIFSDESMLQPTEAVAEVRIQLEEIEPGEVRP